MKTPMWALVFVALLCFAACKETSHPATPPRRPTVIDPTTAATVTGVVEFAGDAPTPPKIDMSQDPACGNQPRFGESLEVTNGDLANVFVYVKDGLADDYFSPPAEPLTIEQKGCQYRPHVAGAMAGQTIDIVNDDNTTHNVHSMPKESRQWNESQMSGAPPIEKKFDHPEIMIPIKCNQHPWMHMYLNVVSNPFFAVTGKDGKFEIHGLPPGSYTIAAVHEKLGEQDVKVTVSPKESKSVDFTFKATP